jgi:hypothetical protein
MQVPAGMTTRLQLDKGQGAKHKPARQDSSMQLRQHQHRHQGQDGNMCAAFRERKHSSMHSDHVLYTEFQGDRYTNNPHVIKKTHGTHAYRAQGLHGTGCLAELRDGLQPMKPHAALTRLTYSRSEDASNGFLDVKIRSKV